MLLAIVSCKVSDAMYHPLGQKGVTVTGAAAVQDQGTVVLRICLVLSIFILTAQFSNQTNEMRLKPLSHICDVIFCSYATRGTEDVCGVFSSYMHQL